MTGKAEVERQRQKLDATFKRALTIGGDAELLSDFARYLCVLVAGFLEQAIIEIALEHVRTQSGGSVQQHVEPRLRRFTNANTQRIVELIGSFDSDWHADLEKFLVDEYKDSVNSVVDLRHGISHGRPVGVTMARMQAYYVQVKKVVEHIANLCTSA